MTRYESIEWSCYYLIFWGGMHLNTFRIQRGGPEKNSMSERGK